jgi:uncharacterized protein YciI
MEFCCYHRDRYDAELIVRGPTSGADGETPTGSVHSVDLPGAAARAFAFDEPGYQAGVYRDALLRRWRNLLGRTMWEFPGGCSGGDRYLLLGLGAPGAAADLAVPSEQDELIAYGPLLSDDGAGWVDTAVLLRAAGPETARAVLDASRYAGVEVHEWEFGGRR